MEHIRRTYTKLTLFQIFLPMAFCASSCSVCPWKDPPSSKSQLLDRDPPDKIWGVTIDSLANFHDTLEAIGSLPKKLTVRVVFDEFVNASTYVDSLTQLKEKAFVMGEILDSSSSKEYTVQDYQARTSEYLSLLKNQVDIWEIGNEVNGEWLGSTNDVVAKVSGAYDLVKTAGGSTELTLYYNEDCWASPANEMFTWAEANIPTRIKTGLDYVLISYYEQDCNGLRPDWPAVFDRLGIMFPNSKIGIGEMGAKNPADKQDSIKRYYSMQINHPRFIGGNFYWFFVPDMSSTTRPLWSYFRDLLLTL